MKSIGYTWQSPQGKKEIVGVMAEPPKYRIKIEGSPFDHFLDVADLDGEVKRDESNLRSRREAEAQFAKEKEKLEERQSWLGFTQTLTPKMRGKAVIKLEQIIGVNGKFTAIGDLVVERVEAGWRVLSSKRFGRVLESPTGSFSAEKDLGKIAFDFAEYLIHLHGEK